MINKCKLCFSQKNKILGQINKYKLIRCLNCDVVFISPQPIKNEINCNNLSLYESQSLEKAYFKKSRELINRAEKCADLLTRYRRNGELLEIGCSYGFYLNTFKKREYNTVGIDISQKAINYAKQEFKLNVIKGDFSEYPFKSGKKDIITLFDVLEHFPNPQLIVKKINIILKENGIVIIQTPNFRSIMSRCTGLKWFWLLVPQHLYLYSVESLRFLLEKNKFKIVNIYTWDDNEEVADNLLGNFRIRRTGKGKIVYIIMSKILLMLLPVLSYLWNKLYLGGEILIYAKKTE